MRVFFPHPISHIKELQCPLRLRLRAPPRGAKTKHKHNLISIPARQSRRKDLKAEIRELDRRGGERQLPLHTHHQMDAEKEEDTICEPC
jgi:hypothetical protein